MKKIIMFIIAIVILTSAVHASSNLYLSITLDYASGQLTKKDIRLIQSAEALDLSKKTGNFKLVLTSFNEEILFQSYFDIATQITPSALKEWFDENGNQIGTSEKPIELELKKASVAVFVPFYKNGKLIKIYDKNNELKLTIDISGFSTCNMNKVCDLKESHSICPEDCPSGARDGVCDLVRDGRCDPDCKPGADLDCNCGNGVCEKFENAKTCPIDCKLSLWQKIVNFIKNIFK